MAWSLAVLTGILWSLSGQSFAEKLRVFFSSRIAFAARDDQHDRRVRSRELARFLADDGAQNAVGMLVVLRARGSHRAPNEPAASEDDSHQRGDNEALVFVTVGRFHAEE